MYKFITKKVDFFIPLLIAGFSFFVAYHDVGSGIINYTDHNFPFYFSTYLKSLFFAWNDSIYLGINQSTGLVNGISYYSIFSFFEKIGFNYILINRLEYVISTFCIIYFTYLFLQSLFKDAVSTLHKISLVLVSTFFLTNILTTGLFTDGLTQGVFAMSGIPLILYSLRKYGLTHKKVFLLPMIIGSLIITSFNLPYNVIFMITVLLLAILFNDIAPKSKIKNIFLFLIIWSFVNCFWIIPMFYSIFIAPPYNLRAAIDNTSALADVLHLTTARYTLGHLLGLGINLDIVRIQNSDNSSLLIYFASRWLVLLSYITMIGLFLRHLLFTKEKNRMSVNPLPLIGIFLVFVFLAKELNQPLGGLYNYLFAKTTFFKIFRDSLKWMTIPFLAITILMANVLISDSKKWLKLIVVLFLLFNLFPWFYNGLMGQLRAYNVPDYYFALNNYYKNIENSSNNRAVILDSVVAPTSFKFDAETSNGRKNLSSNILKFISPFPPIDLFSTGGGISFDYINNIFKNLNKTDGDISAFQKLGATYIYHQRDLIEPSSYNYTDKYFNKTTFGKIDVYEIKKDYIAPKIFLSNIEGSAILNFLKINPTKYELSIKNIKSSADLDFLYTIDQNWKLYLKQNPTSSWCSPFENYGNTQTTECISEQKFFQGEELSYLYQKPIFDNTHQLVNNYANGWTIDPNYIRQNFDKSYYKENPDGSIDIELTLYFRSQSYFYLGLIISGTTLFVCLGYLTFSIFRRKKNLVNMDATTIKKEEHV